MHLNTKKQTLCLLALVIATITGHTLTAGPAPALVKIHYTKKSNQVCIGPTKKLLKELLDGSLTEKNQNDQVIPINLYYNPASNSRYQKNPVIATLANLARQRNYSPIGVVIYIPKAETIQTKEDCQNLRWYMLNTLKWVQHDGIMSAIKQNESFSYHYTIAYEDGTSTKIADYKNSIQTNLQSNESIKKNFSGLEKKLKVFETLTQKTPPTITIGNDNPVRLSGVAWQLVDENNKLGAIADVARQYVFVEGVIMLVAIVACVWATVTKKLVTRTFTNKVEIDICASPKVLMYITLFPSLLELLFLCYAAIKLHKEG